MIIFRSVRILCLYFVIALFLSGCSSINLFVKNYTPPENYQDEISNIWKKVNSQIPLKYDYKISIVDGKDSKELKGVPTISNRNVLLPLDFVKYVYKNYYDDRQKIFLCVIVHEMSHAEFNLASKPPEMHFITDVRAIKLLGNDKISVDNYYKSLYVVKKYWAARKGVAGHAVNIGWNAANLASVAFGGPGFLCIRSKEKNEIDREEIQYSVKETI